jgi:branched-subunit amino acid transport protein
MRDGAAAFVSWFLAGIATALAGGIVFVLTRNATLAVLTGLAVLGLLRLAYRD